MYWVHIDYKCRICRVYMYFFGQQYEYTHIVVNNLLIPYIVKNIIQAMHRYCDMFMCSYKSMGVSIQDKQSIDESQYPKVTDSHGFPTFVSHPSDGRAEQNKTGPGAHDTHLMCITLWVCFTTCDLKLCPLLGFESCTTHSPGLRIITILNFLHQSSNG